MASVPDYTLVDVMDLDEHEVVGLLDGGHVVQWYEGYYTGEWRLQDWLDGKENTHVMSEVEAGRVGVEDYQGYVDRLREMNRSLFDD
jgi:hypothetical protein